MKITGITTIPVPATDKGKKADSKGKARSTRSGESSASSDSVPQTDSADVGGHVETLSLIRDLVAANPDIRLDEVDRIARQLKSKKYKIDFERVAEGFIKEAILTEISRKPRKN